MPIDLVTVVLSHGQPLIWKLEDARVLREQCRLCGRPVGCQPRAAMQNQRLGLPLLLMPEELRLLLDIGRAHLLEDSASPATDKHRSKYDDVISACRTQQAEYSAKNKRKERELLRDKIISGLRAKRRRLLDEREAKGDCVTEEERAAVEHDVIQIPEVHDKTLPGSSELTQIFTVSPWQQLPEQATSFLYPRTARDSNNYAVFRKLWEEGYWLTDGTKFGALYLVYPGDPLRYHAKFAAEVSNEDVVTSVPLLGRMRSINSAKKTLLVAVTCDQKQMIDSEQRKEATRETRPAGSNQERADKSSCHTQMDMDITSSGGDKDNTMVDQAGEPCEVSGEHSDPHSKADPSQVLVVLRPFTEKQLSIQRTVHGDLLY